MYISQTYAQRDSPGLYGICVYAEHKKAEHFWMFQNCGYMQRLFISFYTACGFRLLGQAVYNFAEFLQAKYVMKKRKENETDRRNLHKTNDT